MLFGGMAIGILIATAAAHADSWPTRPIRVISPFAAGSASDSTGRVVVDQMSQLLGQGIVVEPRPGAGGTLGFAEVARSDPNGYTLVTSSSSMGTEVVLDEVAEPLHAHQLRLDA